MNAGLSARLPAMRAADYSRPTRGCCCTARQNNRSDHLTNPPGAVYPAFSPMPLKAVAPRRLYRQIAAQIRGLIGNGEFAPGARLPAERDLARQLRVSRPSLREALIAVAIS